MSTQYDINKVVEYFLNKHQNSSKYKIKYCNTILSIEIKIPEENNFNIFKVFISFYLDSISVSFYTDDIDFKKSIFYLDFIETNKYKNAWKIIQKKYESKIWIEKFLEFIETPSNNMMNFLYEI